MKVTAKAADVEVFERQLAHACLGYLVDVPEHKQADLEAKMKVRTPRISAKRRGHPFADAVVQLLAPCSPSLRKSKKLSDETYIFQGTNPGANQTFGRRRKVRIPAHPVQCTRRSLSSTHRMGGR